MAVGHQTAANDQFCSEQKKNKTQNVDDEPVHPAVSWYYGLEKCPCVIQLEGNKFHEF